MLKKVQKKYKKVQKKKFKKSSKKIKILYIYSDVDWEEARCQKRGEVPFIPNSKQKYFDALNPILEIN